MEQPQKSLSWSEPIKPPVSAPVSAPAAAPVHKPAASVPPPPQRPQTESNKNMTVRYVSIGVVAFVLLAAGAAWSVGRSKPVSSNLNAVQNTPVAKNIENSAALSAPVAAADVSLGALTVQNQPAGLSVAIANASVATETWLVVYESRAGKPGNVLGAALFFPGSSSGTVELLRATRAGETYFVGKSTDNGDRRFSMTTDTPVTDAAGAAQLVTFIAQ